MKKSDVESVVLRNGLEIKKGKTKEGNTTYTNIWTSCEYALVCSWSGTDCYFYGEKNIRKSIHKNYIPMTTKEIYNITGHEYCGGHKNDFYFDGRKNRTDLNPSSKQYILNLMSIEFKNLESQWLKIYNENGGK